MKNTFITAVYLTLSAILLPPIGTNSVPAQSSSAKDLDKGDFIVGFSKLTLKENPNKKMLKESADTALSKKCIIDSDVEMAEETPELPAGSADWDGEDSDNFLSNPILNKRLRKLLDEKNYETFLESFETVNPLEKTGNVIFGSGCIFRACTRHKSAITVDLQNRTIHVAIFNQIADTIYFAEKGSETPDAISNWAKRRKDPKNTGLDDEPETNKPEAVLIDEFAYGNREDMMLRIDNYANNIQNDPAAKGSIIIYGDKKSRTTAEKEIKDYLKRRGLDLKRFVFLTAAGNERALIELWLVPEGAEAPAPKKSADQKESAETEIIALEKQAWEEWKKGNKKFVEGFLADDAFFVYPEGVLNKSQIVEAVGSCDFNSYSLDDFKVQMLDKNSALVSYTAKQDIVCGGNPAPAVVRSTSVYVRRGGKWFNTFYTETAATQ